MKMSVNQMITIVCILAVGFVSVAPFFLQEANAGADKYYKEGYKVYSFATGEFLRYDDVYEEAMHTPHYNYYHYPGSALTAWEHYQTWPDGHGYFTVRKILGTKWE